MVKVLVIKPSSLGDIIHSAPGVERLARSRADCDVTWVANSEYVDFVRDLPGVCRVVDFPRSALRRGRWSRSAPALTRWLRELRGGFDIAIDLQGLQRSSLMARLSGAGERYGLADAREGSWIHYNHRIEVPADLHHAIDRVEYTIDEVLRTSSTLGIVDPQPASSAFRLSVPETARRRAREIRSQDPRPLVVLCPGARWQSKLWPAARWGELLTLLSRNLSELRPIFLGAPGEVHVVEAIHGTTTARAESLVGELGLWETVALFEQAAAAVTMDSAPLHMAVAVGTPSVSFFGPTSTERVGPREPMHRVLQEDLDCLACYERRCPLDERACIPQTSGQRALDALRSIVQEAPAAI